LSLHSMFKAQYKCQVIIVITCDGQDIIINVLRHEKTIHKAPHPLYTPVAVFN